MARTLIVMLVCCSWLLVPRPAISQAADQTDPGGAVAQFYRGKQIILIVGSEAGGGYDLLARLMARHLGQHIPGQPHLIVQNVPTANSLLAANNLFNSLPADGTYIALLIRNMLMAPITNPSGARFKVDRFKWIGSLASETAVALAWHTAPVKKPDDLFKKELIVGGMTGVDPETTPRVYNALIGTKFKIVNGYKGTTDIALAMERGEVEGIADWSWSSLNSIRPEWLRDQKVRLLLQGALTKNSDIANVPFALDYVKNDFDRQVMRLYFAQKEAARPVAAPPGIPAERLNALRTAFMRMAQDPDFLDAAAKSQLLINPAAGSAVQEVAAMIGSAPDQVVKRLVTILSAQPR
jgi:hypothetical protein